MSDFPFAFGPWLKLQIALKDLAVVKFAKGIGANESTVFGWLSKAAPNVSLRYRARIAEQLGVPVGVVSAAVEAAKANAGYTTTVERLYRLQFGKAMPPSRPMLVDPDEPVGEGGLTVGHFDTQATFDRFSVHGLCDIPEFDLSVAAGGWADAEAVAEVRDPRVIEQGLFRVRIRGDSMMKAWSDGDVAEFRVHRADRDALAIGADYYVHRSDDCATFKRLVGVDEDRLTLAAVNRKKYPDPIRVARQEVVRLARAVGKFVPVEAGH